VNGAYNLLTIGAIICSNHLNWYRCFQTWTSRSVLIITRTQMDHGAQFAWILEITNDHIDYLLPITVDHLCAHARNGLGCNSTQRGHRANDVLLSLWGFHQHADSSSKLFTFHAVICTKLEIIHDFGEMHNMLWWYHGYKQRLHRFLRLAKTNQTAELARIFYILHQVLYKLLSIQLNNFITHSFDCSWHQGAHFLHPC